MMYPREAGRRPQGPYRGVIGGVVLWAAIVTIAIMLVILMPGCASVAPPPMRIDHKSISDLVPPPIIPVNMSGLNDFEDIALDPGKCGLPGGILVSDKTYVESLKTYTQRDRLVIENRVLYKLISQERLFQDSLAARVNTANAKLAKEQKNRAWWVFSGAAAVILTAGATWRLTK